MFCLDETYSTTEGYPGGSVPMQAMWVWSLRQEDLLEKEMAIYSSTLPGKFHGQRSLVGYSQWGHKESDTTE